MRRDLAKAQDYARRHGVPRAYDRAGALIDDPEVDAVYIATPPSSHCELALAVAAAGKPCLVEKPMAMNHGECLRMTEAFAARAVPLWVAYYRRALPRFLTVRDLLAANAIGRVTSYASRSPSRWRPPSNPTGDSIRRSPAPDCCSTSGRTVSICSISSLVQSPASLGSRSTPPPTGRKT